MKAYTTRVGNGPFPTELLDDMGATLRQKEMNLVRYPNVPSLRVAGYPHAPVCGADQWSDQFAVTKLDVLTGILKLKICTGYRYRGKMLREFPAEISQLPDCKPVLETFAGWAEDMSDTKDARISLDKRVPICHILRSTLRGPYSIFPMVRSGRRLE